MPTLKQISCAIELADSPFTEHHKRYRDGSVECYVATPDTDHPFSIHVTATGYIEQGIAVFVFIDGVYQCNRNLPIDNRKSVSSKSAITAEFRLRQKEEKLPDGTFVAREWSFTELVKAQEGSRRDKQYEQNVGKIEVIILRCQYASAKTTSTEPAVLAVQPSSTKPASLKVSFIKAASKMATSNADAPELGLNISPILLDGAYDVNLDGPADYYKIGGDNRKDYRIVKEDAPTMLHRQRAPGPDNGPYVRRALSQPYKQHGSSSSDDVYYALYHPGLFTNRQHPHCMRDDADRDYIVPGAWDRDMRRAIPEAEPQPAISRHKIAVMAPPNTLAAHIAYVHEENDALREAGFDPDVLLRLICEDPNVWSINFASMSPGEIKYLRDAIKQWKRKNAADTTGASHKSSHKKNDFRTHVNAVGAGWEVKPAEQQSHSANTDRDRSSKNEKSNEQQATSESNKVGDKSESSGKSTHTAVWDPGFGEDAACITSNTKSDHQTDFVLMDGHGGDAKTSSSSTRSSTTCQSQQSSSVYSGETTSAITAQPYWSIWDKKGSNRLIADARPQNPRSARTAYVYSAPPAPAVSSLSKLDTDRGVQVGKGALYDHKTRRPEYIDTMESPYAVFIFKYCSREKLQQLLGRKIEDDFEHVVAKAEKDKLMSMTKEELAEELMKLKIGNGREEIKTKASSRHSKVRDVPDWKVDESKSAKSGKAAPVVGRKSSKKSTFQPNGEKGTGFVAAAEPGAGAGGGLW